MRLEELHRVGDPLVRLDGVSDRTLFEPVFKRIPKIEPKGPGGLPLFPQLLMFMAIVIRNFCQLNDEQFEFQMTNRLTFELLIDLTVADNSSGEKAF